MIELSEREKINTLTVTFHSDKCELNQGDNMTFQVDWSNTPDGQLTVETAQASIIIIQNSDGVSVDIYPLHSSDGPASSCWAPRTDLEEDTFSLTE